MLKISSESSRGRITDDKNRYVITNFVSIFGIPTSSISNYAKYMDLPRSTKYQLFNKDNVKRK